MSNALRNRSSVRFALIPVCFNLYIWQNYMISGECLIPDALKHQCGSTLAFLAFGLAFGVATALLSQICFSTISTLFKTMKFEKLNEHWNLRQPLYSLFWIVAFTMASFGGFVMMVGFRPPSSAMPQIYMDGLQGFMVAGMSAGFVALAFAAALFCMRHNFQLARVAVTNRRKRQ